MNPFDSLANRYDEWFDSPDGRCIFEAETACLRDVMPANGCGWLEVGVGTGRFAKALGVSEGVDPSPAALKIAMRRGVNTRSGHGEALPYSDASFDGVLMVVTLCFLSDPTKAFKECGRVLRKDGCLVVGFVPSDSPWGRLYARQGREGHPFYSIAKFYTCHQVIQIAGDARFSLREAMSSLFTPPGEPLPPARPPQSGIVRDAGFVALRFLKVNDNGKETP